jgi:hypothetical protein
MKEDYCVSDAMCGKANIGTNVENVQKKISEK